MFGFGSFVVEARGQLRNLEFTYGEQEDGQTLVHISGESTTFTLKYPHGAVDLQNHPGNED